MIADIEYQLKAVSIFAVLLTALLVLNLPLAISTTAYHVTVDCTHHAWVFLDNGDLLSCASGEYLYANSIAHLGDHVNFSQTSLGDPSSPSQTFGVGMLYSNDTIESIEEDSITLSASCVSAKYCYTIYYFNGSSPPPIVSFSVGDPARVVTPIFTPNSYSFQSDSANSVLYNETGRIIIRYQYANSLRVFFTSDLGSYTNSTASVTVTKVVNSTTTIFTTNETNLVRKHSLSQEIVSLGGLLANGIYYLFGSGVSFIVFVLVLLHPERRKQAWNLTKDLLHFPDKNQEKKEEEIKKDKENNSKSKS